MVDFPVHTVISIELLNNATAFNLVMLSKMSVTMRKNWRDTHVREAILLIECIGIIVKSCLYEEGTANGRVVINPRSGEFNNAIIR